MRAEHCVGAWHNGQLGSESSPHPLRPHGLASRDPGHCNAGVGAGHEDA